MRAETKLVLRGGLLAGIFGYGAVVVVGALVDFAAGRPLFYMPALFGSALFHGLEDPTALVISPAPVLSYNMVHLLAFLALGMVASWGVEKAEEHAGARYVILFVLIFVAAHVYGALLLFAQPLLAGSAWWQIGAPGVIAASLMGWYLLRLHPLLRWELGKVPIGAEPPEI